MSQFDLFSSHLDNNEKEEIKNLIPIDGEVYYFKNFFKEVNFKEIEESINWTQDKITLYGKTHNVPRLQAWYADSENLKYSYSGIHLKVNLWQKNLDEIRTQIEVGQKLNFNSCLCNLYRTGSDYAAWHSDDEVELGKNPVIASASFGATRKIVFKHKNDKGIEKIELELEDNSLLLMKGNLQHYWRHQLNKTSKNVGPRINLTFRNIKK